MLSSHHPLADRIRPKTLAEFVGQTHLIGPMCPIRRIIEIASNATDAGKRYIPSLIFWGPPGSGKTTLAKIIANETGANFHFLSAVAAGKADIRQIVDSQLYNKEKQRLTLPHISKSSLTRPLLFLDEIHRFNKAQQDYLLPYVEDGTLTLIGATTENPSFEIVSPLLSRCQIFTLVELTPTELNIIINRGYDAVKLQQERQASHAVGRLALNKNAQNFLISFANGDARQALNLLETTHKLYQKITVANLKKALQSKHLRYDKAGEEHYNTISAFIKSMRASNPDAALYYLARMVDAGEDPLFIARRMVIFASEDIGVAQPTALVVANEVFRACETIGYPECAINLAHGAVYLATAKKDRAAYAALQAALKDVKKFGNLPIPLKIRNAPTKLMKNLGYAKGYEKYTKEDLLPDKLKTRKYFNPK